MGSATAIVIGWLFGWEGVKMPIRWAQNKDSVVWIMMVTPKTRQRRDVRRPWRTRRNPKEPEQEQSACSAPTQCRGNNPVHAWIPGCMTLKRLKKSMLLHITDITKLQQEKAIRKKNVVPVIHAFQKKGKKCIQQRQRERDKSPTKHL